MRQRHRARTRPPPGAARHAAVRYPPRHPPVIAGPLKGIAAVVLDTDGVITDSARVHAAAWKAAFDAHLREHPPPDPAQRRPFDDRTDYLRYVDGKSRHDGAASFLASRGLPSDDHAVALVAERKEQLFAARLRSGDIPAYPGTVRLLRALRAEGVKLAAASASRHARELLDRAQVLDLFEALVDGAEASRMGLPGKPDPALFLEAARRLGRPLTRTAVVEDSLAGVEAGRRGRFALVVGVDRTAGAGTGDALLRHGAHLVVRDLAELLTEEAGP